MKYTVILFSLCVLLCSPMTLISYSLEDALPLLSESQIGSLREGEVLSGETLKGPIAHLAPEGSLAAGKVKELEVLEEGFSITNLSYIPYPREFASLTHEQRMLSVFNTMRSVSTQEGITYISFRRGNEPHLLIRDSWYLETQRSRRRLPDPVASTLPKEDESIVYQRDTSFGGNVYRHKYTIEEREIFLDIDNLETMRVLSILPVVRPEQLNISMSAFFLDDGLLLHAAANIDREPVVSFLGYTVHLPSAFNRRITALQEWFTAQLYSL